MKQNKKITLWTWKRPKRYYFTHPKTFFKDVIWNVKNMQQRMNYGFSASDVFDFNDWFLTVIPNALRYLSENRLAYPGREPYDTEEKWENHLNYLADEIEACKDNSKEYVNQYQKEFDDWMKTNPNEREETFQDKIIKRKYMDREIEITSQKAQRLKNALSQLADDMPFLWD